ncbi:tripartite motif-containing protein 26-like isoform X3 [Acanthaster planci]|uniref:Tripartite motif-containing protein 26-like isoform X3 n=1 Tax=Acanthaster planci TaxID=133434 RepID=A0A8B7YXW3_ACAPL|nr:tripartite motif-containing protein 26-like isoform X3 [Acanthaster planci]
MVTMATRKQLSSVTQRLFTNHLECDICHCPYQDPKTLCCLHSFCMDCLMRYRDARKTRKLHCPVCQQLTQLPSVGVRGLPDSITLMHLAEDMEWIGEQNKDSMNKPTCPKHKAKVMRFYCDTCRMLICRDCIVLDHPRENHQILDTKADRTGYKQALVHHFPDYEKTLASITNDHDRIVEAKRELRDRVDAAIKDVTTRTAEVMCTPEVRAEEEKIIDDIVSTKDQWVILSTSFVKVYNRGNKQLADEFQTRQQGDEVGKVYEAPLSLAIRTDGNIIVGYRGRGTLTEHSPTSGDLVRTIPVQISPSFLAVMSNNWLVISDHVKGLVEVVEVADDKAVTLFTIRPTISGERVKSCRGVCSNDSGIYLGVSTGFHNGGHVHHYDNEGDFISCIAQGLYGPYGITFTADGQELAVADHHSVKIYHKV